MPKVNVGWIIFFSLLTGFLVWAYGEYFKLPKKTVTIKPRKDYDIITLKLPNSIDTEVFGSKYWEAFHTLADMIPCSLCREDAVKMMVFVHDIVNKKIGHPVFDKQNYDKWIKKLCKE